MLKFYDYPACPFCRKVKITLEEKGIEYEKIYVDLRKKEQKKEEFLKLNPYGKVPVIVDNGAVVYESSVINEYLEEKYPNPPLMPSDPKDRARIRIWVDFCETHFHNPWFSLYWEIKFKPEKSRDTELIEGCRNEIKEHLHRLDKELEGQEYLAGSYSLADVAFTPRIAIFDQLEIDVDTKLKNVINWIERIKSRASFQALEL